MPAKIFHLDLYGKRQSKYDTLESLSIVDALWTEVSSVAPYYFFVPKNTDGQGEYEAGFWVNEIFPANVTGIVTAIDNLAIHYSREEATELARKILNSQNPYTEYGIKDQRKHKKEARIAELRESFEDTSPIPIAYRPFDTRYMYYTKKTECWINSPRYAFMRHMLDWENIWIVMKIGHNQELSAPIMITKDIIDFRSWSAPWMQWGDYLHPLYLYTDSETLQNTTPMFATDTGELPPLTGGHQKTPNLDPTIWARIDECVYGKSGEKSSALSGTSFAKEVYGTTPEEVLDYIYAVLHAPTYREKYREFLKIDFPRVPYPDALVRSATNPSRGEFRKVFDRLVTLGGELRGLHLLESPKVHDFITTFPIAGSGEVEKVVCTPLLKGDVTEWQGDFFPVWQVWINSTQYFDNVPLVVWNFSIWGYQPAQKWLKDRKWRVLTWEDIERYQEMIVALMETARVMGEIDRTINNPHP